MANTPYPTRSKIFEASKRAGHVASYVDGITKIETGKFTLTFDKNTEITGDDGKTYTNAEAAKLLDLDLQ